MAEDMDEAIEAANEIAPEHMEIVTANPFEVYDEGEERQARSLSENTVLSLWEIILQVRTMFFRPMEPRNSSPHFL